MKAIHWATFTGVLGVEVNGIWEKYTDTNDVNACDASFQNEVLPLGHTCLHVCKTGLCSILTVYLFSKQTTCILM